MYEGKIYPATTSRIILKAASQLRPTAPATQPNNRPLKIILKSAHKELQDPVLNAVISLADETARSGYGVLVFCSSRPGCESDARIISRVLPSLEELDPRLVEKRQDLLGELRSLPTGLDPVLMETIPAGVAFHHAGMTIEERDAVASAYDNGTIKVIVATCSLAAGINLPARRVILHNARMGRDLVGPSMLRQMRGRAGRKGKDEIGETFLCCRQGDLEEVVDLMNADLPEVSSGLMTDKRRIRRALLEVIAVRLANGKDAIDDYARKTLLSQSASLATLRELVESSLEDLTALRFIEGDPGTRSYSATQLGRAVVASCLEPEDGAFVHRELERALRAFVMDGEMHILYTFTPVQDFAIEVNWQIFGKEMEGLDDSGLRVMKFLGLKPTLVNQM